jgi:UPF0755 protein
MVTRLWVTTLTVLLVGATLTFTGLHILKVHHDRNTTVQEEKKTDIAVTVIEGKRREEIAAQLDAAGVTSYTDFMTASATVEGHLFPDTYRFFPNTPATEVVKAFTDNFTTRTASLHLTKDQLILASIVEREALTDADRPLIAGVYQNRIDNNMTLGADPSVEYAKDTLAYAKNDSKDFKFWGPITQGNYQDVISPFNTYLQTGLPPAPISNPGLKSMEAAITPTQHDFLFFLYKNKKLLLAKTLAQHIANQQ